MATERERDRAGWALVLLLASIGVALRVLELVRAHSLWIDEARVAINIGARSLRELLAPLDLEQVAPPLFLWSTKLLTLAFGMSDEVLRAVPFVGSIALLPIAYRAAKSLTGRAEARFVLALLALSPIAIKYAAELKPYGVDAMFSALVLATARARDRGAGPAGFLAAGSLAIVGMTPAPFVVVPTAGWLWWRHRSRGERDRAQLVLVATLAWLTVFAALFFAIYRHAAGHPMMQRYWEWGFLVPGHALERAQLAYPVVLDSFARAPALGVALYLVCAPVAVAGGVLVLEKRERGLGLLLIAPLLLTLGASAVRSFVIVDRLLLFTLPHLAILVGAAVWELSRRLTATRPIALMAGLTLVVLARSAVDAVERQQRTRVYVPSPALVAAVAQDIERGRTTGVYVPSRAGPQWVYYTTDWSAPDLARVRWFIEVAQAGGPLFENMPTRGGPVDEPDLDRYVRPFAGGVEVFGVPSGQELRYQQGLLTLEPDTGVVDLEVARVESLGSSAWIVSGHDVDSFPFRLLSELGKRGWQIQDVRRGYELTARRIEKIPTEPAPR